MLLELARRGWVCVTINYRLSPKATWPDHIVDCKMARRLGPRAHRRVRGRPRASSAVSGGSAGRPPERSLALTPGDRAFQPGFEERDTSVDACVPVYGVYDMTCSSGRRRSASRGRLQQGPAPPPRAPGVQEPTYARGPGTSSSRPRRSTGSMRRRRRLFRHPRDERHPGPGRRRRGVSSRRFERSLRGGCRLRRAPENPARLRCPRLGAAGHAVIGGIVRFLEGVRSDRVVRAPGVDTGTGIRRGKTRAREPDLTYHHIPARTCSRNSEASSGRGVGQSRGWGGPAARRRGSRSSDTGRSGEGNE